MLTDGEQLRLLILEDVPADAALVERELRSSGLEFVSRRVETEPEFLAALADFKPCLVLSDYSLPSFNGLAALRLVQQRLPSVPVIIVTGSIDEETAAECIKAGAADYVLKDRLARLPAAIRGAIERQRLADDKRRAEAALRESDERYRLIFDKSLDAVLLTAPDGRIFAANPAACRLFGREENEICELGRGGILDEADPRLAAGVEARARTGSFSGELMGLRRDGARFPVDVSSSVFEDRSGNPRTAMIIRDLSEHKRAEGLIRASEIKYRRLFEAARDGILILDAETGRVLDVNPFLVDLLGIPREEFLASKVWELGFLADVAASQAKFAELQRRGYVRYADLPLQTADGRTIAVEFVSNVYLAGDQTVVQCNIRDITAHKRADAALLESEAQLRAIFELASVGIAQADPRTGRWLRVNQRMCSITGYTADELLALRVPEITHPDDRQEDWEAFQRVVNGEAADYRLEKRYLRKDGSVVWVNVNMTVIRGEDGRPIRTVATIEDITERRRAEDTLRESEERYRDLVENSSDLICTHDLDGTLLSANAAAMRVSGFQMDRVGRFNLRDLVSPRDRASVDTYLEIIRREGSATGVMRVITRSGDVRYWEYRNSLRTEGVPTPVVRGVARDVTERTRAEKALQESEERFRSLVAHSPDGIFLVDLKGNFLSVNETICRGLGFDEAEMLAMSLWDIVPEGQWETHKARLARVLKGESLDDTVQYEVRAKTGQLVPVEVRSAPYRKGGEIVGFQAIARDITERKRAEEALRESDERFRAAFASSPIGMALVAPDGRYLEVNSALCRIVGYSEEEVLARTFQEITHPDDLESDLAHVRQMLAGVILTYQLEKRFLHKKGQVVWVLLSVALVRDDAGQPLYFVSQIQDITEAKLAAQALRESQERYRLIAENTADVIWTLDLATRRFTYVSPSIERLRGFSPEEVLAQPFEASLTPDSLARVEARLASALAALAAGDQSGRSMTMEVDQPTKTGGIVRTEIVASALTFAGNHVTSVLGVTRDVTERRRAEEALRLRDGALAAAANAIVITDSQGRIEWANPAFTSLTGHELAEVRGQSLRILNSGVQDDVFYRELWRTITSGSVWHGEMVNKRRDGALYSEEMTITPVRGTSGSITHFIAVKQDITEHKRLEDQLRQSQKMEAVGQLAGGVAHDFNNLLQAMLSLTQMLTAHHADPKRLAADTVELEQLVKRGAALTRQLLLFSRRETVRAELLDLNEVVRDSLTLLRRLLKAHIAIETRMAEGRLPVEGDRGQLGQILLNLTVNAADAMPGGGRLMIETGSEDGAVWIKIADTGAGIPAAVRSRVFEPFFTTKGQGKGTGLGLSVVHGIVVQHGGTVTFESREGQGTAFTVTLPRAGSGESPAVEIAERDGTAPRGHGELVLVVEDEESARQALAEMLSALGYTVTAVGSGEEAGRLAPEPAFDVLLTDLMLPGISGSDLIVGLQARWPDLRAVLMSGYAEDETVRLAARTGAVRFLQKPFDMDTLARELRAALETA